MSEHTDHAHAHDSHHGPEGTVHLPAPTLWPFMLALGVALLLAGLLTHWMISLLGFLMIVPSIVGWFRNVLPEEDAIYAPIVDEPVAITTMRQKRPAVPLLRGTHFELKPLEGFSIAAGLLGGLTGSVAMAIVAAVWGIIAHGSIWFPINLMAAGGFLSWADQPDSFFAAFHPEGLLAAVIIHGLVSISVGLVYGALLPIFPKKPVITAGIIAPLLWSATVYLALGIISPILNSRISWPWFIVSQIAFGLICGFVVNMKAKVSSEQFRELPLAVRAGLHSDQPLTEDGNGHGKH